MTIKFSLVEYSFLSSLGLNFDAVPDFRTQPEKGIMSLLNKDEFIGNYMYGMLKLFFSVHHAFLRVDVFESEAHSLTPVGHATLSALCSFCERELNDKRFKKIRKYSLRTPSYLNTVEYIEKIGKEEDLSERGILVRPILIQDLKKIKNKDWVFKNNLWFKNRLILGLGVRADAFSALATNSIKTYYELSKILGSSLFSARKNYNDYFKIKSIDPRIISLESE